MTQLGSGNWLERLFEQHKFVRRSIVLWAAMLITWVTLRLFDDPASITASGAAAYATATGLLAAAIGLYQYSRDREDRDRD